MKRCGRLQSAPAGLLVGWGLVLILDLGGTFHARAQPYRGYRNADYGADEPWAMVENRGQAAFEPLVASLKGRKSFSGVIETIAATRHPEVKGFLLTWLEDPKSLDENQRQRIRTQAIEALEIYGDEPDVARALARVLLDDKVGRTPQETAAKVLKRVANPAAADVLLQVASKIHWGNYPLLNLFAEALAATDSPKVVAYLRYKLTERYNAYVPWYDRVAMGLARRGSKDPLPELIEAARYGLGGRTVVTAVYRALGLMGDRRAVDVLREAVVKRDFRIRFWSAVSLGRLGDKRALPELREAFGKVKDYAASKLHVNRSAIAYARARLGDREGERFLVELSQAEKPVHRMYGLIFLMLAHADDKAGAKWAEKVMAELRPYKDISSGPRFPDELIAEFTGALGKPLALRLLQEMASWDKAGRVPHMARKVLERMGSGVRVNDLVAQIRTGTWEQRNQAARLLDKQVRDPFAHYAKLLKVGDVQARVLAVRRLGLFAPKRFRKQLGRARKDPAWQVSHEASRIALIHAGKNPYPEALPRPPVLSKQGLSGYMLSSTPRAAQAYKPAQHPLDKRTIRRLREDGSGRIWVATKIGLQRYDGMQWKLFDDRTGMCRAQVRDVAVQGERVIAASGKGVAISEGEAFRCHELGLEVYRVAVSGKRIFLGTDRGVFELRGKKARKLGGPAKPIGSLVAGSAGAVWAALAPSDRQPEDSQADPPVHRFHKGRWSAFDEPFHHYNGKLNRRTGHAREPVSVQDLAVDRSGQLYLATSYGIFRHSGGRFTSLSRGRGYYPWNVAHAVRVTPDGRVMAGYPGYVDVLDKGRWQRLELQELPDAKPYVVRGTPVLDLLFTSNGELWLAGASGYQLGPRTFGNVLRKVVQDDKRIALPPDTMIAMVRGGAFMAQEKETDMAPPNRARRFEAGKTIEIPASVVSITAVAKDPWDYSGVEYRHKVDESDWTDWSDNNALISPQILDEGIHRIQVQSRDAQKNVDPSPAEVRFTVHTKELTVIKIHDGQFQRIFPSQYVRYQKVGLGRVKVENTRQRPVEVDLEMKIEDLFERPASSNIELAAGESRWVAVAAPFSNKVLQNEGQRTVQAVVEAKYSWEEVERSTRRSFSLELLEANAFLWDEPARLGAFINGRDPLVQKLAADLYRSFAKQHPQQARASHPLRNYLLALYGYQALHELGIRYKPDPNRPFASIEAGTLDTVQYPSQTLTRKAGDCDDLTVLYTSVLENLNVPTAVVPVEGHVFAMFDSGVRVENRAAFPVDARKTVERDGTLWVPVETTLLGKPGGFEAAWGNGAEHYHGKYKPSPKSIVRVRTAWQEFPPATFSAPGRVPFKGPRLARAVGEAGTMMKAYGARVEKLAGAGKGDPASLLRRGGLLVKSGLFDQAIQAYQAALALERSFEAHYGLGAANAGKGEILQALLSFQQALSKASGNRQKFRSQLAIAQCYKVNGNLKKARKHLGEALKMNPAARFDARTSALLRYLKEEAATKAATEDETPPFFQEILTGL